MLTSIPTYALLQPAPQELRLLRSRGDSFLSSDFASVQWFMSSRRFEMLVPRIHCMRLAGCAWYQRIEWKIWAGSQGRAALLQLAKTRKLDEL